MNVSDLLRQAALSRPESTALISGGGVRVTYGQVDDRVERTASALARLGIRSGDRVALLLGNDPDFVSSFYGVLRRAAVACPLNVNWPLLGRLFTVSIRVWIQLPPTDS